MKIHEYAVLCVIPLVKTWLIRVILIALLPSAAFAKRSAPDAVPTLAAGDVVYSAPHFTGGGSKEPVRGGVVEARDVKSGNLLWTVRIYKTVYDAGLETDVQDVFIKTLTHDKTHDLLILSDENGRVFVLDLKSRKSTQVR